MRFVELYASKAKLTKDLKAIGAELEAWGKGITSIGKKVAMAAGAITAPMMAAVWSWAHASDELYHMAQRTGMSVQSLSALRYAANMTGTSLESVESSIHKMNKALYAAMNGSSEALLALNRLGLSIGQLMQMSPDQQFTTIAEALSKIANPAVKDALAMQLLGKGAKELGPLMSELKERQEEARKYGLIASPEAVASAHALTNAWKLMTSVLGSFRSAIGTALAPMLTGLAHWIAENAVRAREWLKEHRPMVVQAFLIASAALGAGTALIVLGKAFSFAGAAVKGLRAAILAVAHGIDLVLLPVKVAIRGIQSLVGAAASIGSAVLSGLGTVAGVITRGLGLAFQVAAGVALMAFQVAMAGIGVAANAAAGLFQAAWSAAGVAVPGIFSAIGTAFQITMSLMQASGVAAVLVLQSAWTFLATLIPGLFTTAIATSQAFAAAFPGVTAFLVSIWQSTVSALTTAWQLGMDALQATGKAFVEVWGDVMGLVGAVTSAAIGVISAGWGIVLQVVTAIGTAVSTVWSIAMAAVAAVTTGVVAAASATWMALLAVGSMVGGLIAAAWSAAMATVPAASTVAAGSFGAVWGVAAAAWAAICSTMSTVFAAAQAALIPITTAVAGTFDAIWTAAIAALPELLAAAAAVAPVVMVAAFVAGTALIVAAVIIGAKKIVATIFELGMRIGSSIASAISGAFRAGLSAIKAIGSAIGQVASSVVSAGAKVFSSLGTIVGQFVTWSGSAFTYMWDTSKTAFSNVAEEGKGAWSAITAALQAGQIEAAISVVMAFVRLEWLRGVNWMMDHWDEFKGYWSTAMEFLKLKFNDISAEIQKVWAELINIMSAKWDEWMYKAIYEFQEKGGKLADWVAAAFGMSGVVKVLTGGGPVQTPEEQKKQREGIRAGQTARDEKEIEDARKKREAEIKSGAKGPGDAGSPGADEAARSKREKDRQAAQAEIDDAKKALDKAIADAKSKAAGATKPEMKEPPKPGEFELPGSKKIEGTYSGLAAGMIGGSGGVQMLGRKLDRLIAVNEDAKRWWEKHSKPFAIEA